MPCLESRAHVNAWKNFPRQAGGLEDQSSNPSQIIRPFIEFGLNTYSEKQKQRLRLGKDSITFISFQAYA